MFEFLNEVFMIEDDEPDFIQMGISGKSGAKMKAPDGGKASMKGDFNALHPRYPKGHPRGGKFMPKGSKDQINAVAKAKGVSTEKAAELVGTKPLPNKGKLKKFSGSAGAVGKAQKVLRDKNATPEQRAKAKASILKAAGKMRGDGDAPVVTEKPKQGKNKAVKQSSVSSSAIVLSQRRGSESPSSSPSAKGTGKGGALPSARPAAGWFAGTIQSKARIKRRLKELAKKFHPDRGGDVEKMQQINKEYENAMEYTGLRKYSDSGSGRAKAKAVSRNKTLRQSAKMTANAKNRKRFADMFSPENEIKF